MKPPRAGRRSLHLAEWTLEKYPYMKKYMQMTSTGGIDRQAHTPKCPADKSVPAWLAGRYVYGVYGETPDSMPLVGKTRQESNICYLVC